MSGVSTANSGEVVYLSKSEFAASQGWSPSYITKLKDQNRLVMDEKGKRVNVQATLALLNRTSDPGKESIREHHASGRVDKHVRSHLRLDAPGTEEGGGTADPKYWHAKARREDTLAQLAELELAKKSGEQVDRARVEAAAYATARMLRDALLGLPTRIAPALASMTDPFEIEMKLRDALRQVLDDMSKMSADDLEKAIGPSH